MKRILALIIAVGAIMCAMAQGAAKIEFAETKHDFGTIHEKDGKVTKTFEFQNVGDMPLVITTAYASCGCTTPTYPEDPIAPGEKGKVTVSYNPANRAGEFSSTVTVLTNDKKHKRVKLKLTGTVVPKP